MQPRVRLVSWNASLCCQVMSKFSPASTAKSLFTALFPIHSPPNIWWYWCFSWPRCRNLHSSFLNFMRFMYDVGSQWCFQMIIGIRTGSALENVVAILFRFSLLELICLRRFGFQTFFLWPNQKTETQTMTKKFPISIPRSGTIIFLNT